MHSKSRGIVATGAPGMFGARWGLPVGAFLCPWDAVTADQGQNNAGFCDLLTPAFSGRRKRHIRALWASPFPAKTALGENRKNELFRSSDFGSQQVAKTCIKMPDVCRRGRGGYSRGRGAIALRRAGVCRQRPGHPAACARWQRLWKARRRARCRARAASFRRSGGTGALPCRPS